MFLVRSNGTELFRLCPSTGIVFGQYGYRRGEAMPGGSNQPKPDKGMRAFKMVKDFSESEGVLYFYSSNDQFIHRLIFDTDEESSGRPRMEKINLGVNPMHIQAMSQNDLLIEDMEGQYFMMKIPAGEKTGTVREIENAHPISISPF